jgi:hypothetical protein
LYRECFRCLKPGGWLEQQEFALHVAGNDGPLPDDCVWRDWGRIFREAGEKMGRTFEVTNHWDTWLGGAGFTGTWHFYSVRLPIGDWPADLR